VPRSTVSEIISSLQICGNLQNAYLLNSLKEICEEIGLEGHKIEEVLQKFADINIFYNIHHVKPLHSAYNRENFFSKNSLYVKPVPIRLNAQDLVSRNDAIFHYVLILKTIKALFQDPNIRKQLFSPEATMVDYSDVFDGLVYKNNSLFRRFGSKALSFILYQDEFEVCNPLGQAKGTHKILGVYFTLANLYVPSRSKVDSLQLALLCKHQFITTSTLQAVFQPLLQDLHILETAGIDLGFGMNVYGSLLCITGDNLGSHSIGRFFTNFGNSEYLCHVCTIKPNT